MAYAERSIFINAPMEKVFDYAVEPDNVPKWVRNCVEIWERSEGLVAVGTTYRELSTIPGGMKTKSINEITEFNRPHKFVSETRNGVRLTIVCKLKSKNGGTLLTMSGDWMMGGKFLTVLLDKLFMGRWLVKNFVNSLEDLKKQVEG